MNWGQVACVVVPTMLTVLALAMFLALEGGHFPAKWIGELLT